MEEKWYVFVPMYPDGAAGQMEFESFDSERTAQRWVALRMHERRFSIGDVIVILGRQLNVVPTSVIQSVAFEVSR